MQKKITPKFLTDDDNKIYPEAMACFHIMYLPTVHSTQEMFTKYFECALGYEGCGFSAGI